MVMMILPLPTMIEDDIKEKVLVLLVVVLVGLSYILHIPKMVEVWNESEPKQHITHN